MVDIATEKYKNLQSIVAMKSKVQIEKNLNLVMLTC